MIAYFSWLNGKIQNKTIDDILVLCEKEKKRKESEVCAKVLLLIGQFTLILILNFWQNKLLTQFHHLQKTFLFNLEKSSDYYCLKIKHL